MKLLVPFSFIACVFFWGCTQKPEPLTKGDLRDLGLVSSVIHLTDSNYAVLPFEKNEFAAFKNARGTTLSGPDIKLIETLANQAIAAYNSSEKYQRIENENYKVQLIAVINEKGEKEVWVNGFCSTFGDENWRKSTLVVNDGGSCYFNLKINLTTKRCYDLGVNGIG